MKLRDLFKRKPKKREWTVYDSITHNFVLPDGYTKLSECPEVITAVDRIADLISNMTIHLMRNTELGDTRIKDELAKKIDIYPCKGMSKKAWMNFIVRTLLLEGDGNAVIIPSYSNNNGTSYIENLLPVPAKDFEIIPGPTFKDGYKIQIEDRLFDPSELIHFKINPDPTCPWRGRSYRIPLKQLVDTLNSGEKVKQTFMNGRYMPSIIVKIDGDADEVMSQEGHRAILDRFFTSEKAGEPWIIPGEMMDVESVVPLSLNDIGITETMAQNKEAIAALLGVPSFILGVGEFNAAEYNNFVKDRVLGIAKEIEQTLTSQLLISPDLYFKFNVRSLYAYDLNTQASVGGLMFDKGLMTGNEVRDWLGLEPHEELENLKILENFIPVEDSGNQKKLNKDNETEESTDETDNGSDEEDDTTP